MTEIYFSTDVEADGPIPGPHSMLSFASVAFAEDGRMVASFTRNLELLPGAAPHPATATFWAENAAAFAATRNDLMAPEIAMPAYVEWIDATARDARAKPVFVAYPAGFDFLFVYWYLMRFAGRSPFSHSALDMKSYAAALLDLPYREVTKRTLHKHWPSQRPHTHVALDDAIEQGEIFCRMRQAARRPAMRSGSE